MLYRMGYTTVLDHQTGILECRSTCGSDGTPAGQNDYHDLLTQYSLILLIKYYSS